MSKSLLRPRKARNDESFRQIHPNSPHRLCSDLNALMQKTGTKNQSADHVTVASFPGHGTSADSTAKSVRVVNALSAWAVPMQLGFTTSRHHRRAAALRERESGRMIPPTSKQ
ncbi:hypothetical protein [Bradyrhizobium acaciae]|uniref:hypothetical protein n=1 Tax=Bradyrhizobium acaciae TaxID=2683706 RepID=UPI001E53A720|nr:hypothetical protein [Bradyrhizobium acaciae]MCC8980421.1 hypothetical protein [Bradyrhizobium acaciae]